MIKYDKRYLTLLIGFICLLAAVIIRLTYLHIYKHDFLLSAGKARTVREVKIPAYRGMIKDRNGESLAISTQVDSVWVNPQMVNINDAKINYLANLLSMPSAKVRSKIRESANAKKEFLYLQRHIDPRLGKKIKSLKIAGVNIIPEYRRYYPHAEISAQLLGFTDVDDKGREGIELWFNEWLQGTPGKRRIEQDRLGREVENVANISDAVLGNDLILSIDERLQYLTYKAVKAAVEKHRARSGCAVVLDVKTGEVLAMVNNPSFNPNKRTKKAANNFRNVAVTDAFEPGSVIKTFSLASVLENTKVTPATLVDTRPGVLKLPGGVVRDIHQNGVLDVVSILRESSNIGIAKLALNLKPRELCDTYQRFGFGWATNSGFPGEGAGSLATPRQDQTFVHATMSFGYGLTVTPLQLARAYAIIGAGGIKRPVSFLKLDETPAGERVISSHVARQLLEMLTSSVEHERSNARIDGYRLAGKTGTVRLAGKGGYESGKYRAIFGGLAPAINPRLAIVVMINEPSAGEYYSNQVAAPVFAKIASGALRLYKVAPDFLDTHGVHVAHNGRKN